MNATPENINNKIESVDQQVHALKEARELSALKDKVVEAIMENIYEQFWTIQEVNNAPSKDNLNKIISDNSDESVQEKTTIVNTSIDNDLKAQSEEKTTIVNTSTEAANDSTFKTEEKTTPSLSKISLWVKPTNNNDSTEKVETEETKSEEVKKPTWLPKMKINLPSSKPANDENYKKDDEEKDAA